MPLPPTVGLLMGVFGIGREGDGGMSRELLDLEGVTGVSSDE